MSIPQALTDMLSVIEQGDIRMTTRAALVAGLVHAGQTDKAGEPYVDHCRRVAERVREYGGSDDAITAAWLHDTVEDTSLTLDDLATLGFSLPTRAIVEALTYDPKHETRLEYYARINRNDEAVLVKHADIDDNFDEERLSKLDASTAIRLRDKYLKAREALKETS